MKIEDEQNYQNNSHCPNVPAVSQCRHPPLLTLRLVSDRSALLPTNRKGICSSFLTR